MENLQGDGQGFLPRGKDMKKGKQPILYTLSSLSSFLLDSGLFYLLDLLLNSVLGPYAEPVCNLIARTISSFYNFNINRLVFQNRGDYGKALLRYYCLCIPQALISTGLLSLFVWLFHVESAGVSTAIKVAVDGVLFVASFFIQKYWVFKKTELPADSEYGGSRKE